MKAEARAAVAVVYPSFEITETRGDPGQIALMLADNAQQRSVVLGEPVALTPNTRNNLRTVMGLRRQRAATSSRVRNTVGGGKDAGYLLDIIILFQSGTLSSPQESGSDRKIK